MALKNYDSESSVITDHISFDDKSLLKPSIQIGNNVSCNYVGILKTGL